MYDFSINSHESGNHLFGSIMIAYMEYSGYVELISHTFGFMMVNGEWPMVEIQAAQDRY